MNANGADSASRPPAAPRTRWSAVRSVLRNASLLSSAAICAGVWICYAWRPDFAAAVTVFPAWVWLTPGALLIVFGSAPGRRRRAAPPVILWLLFLLAAADEPRALLRFGRRPAAAREEGRATGSAIRIVTLNCATHLAAARETLACEPDIVLLQESPPREHLEALVRDELGAEWTALWGVDSSILVRGDLEAVALPRELSAYFVCGRITLASGARLNAIGLRLRPALVRLDLWSPDCWLAQTENRRQRRHQLQRVVAVATEEGNAHPWIVGGDFNAPAGDAIFRLLEPTLHDGFATAGRGWGNTITGDFPFARIDQIWLSGEFSATSVTARGSQYSDHKMAVCECVLREGRERRDEGREPE